MIDHCAHFFLASGPFFYIPTIGGTSVPFYIGIVHLHFKVPHAVYGTNYTAPLFFIIGTFFFYFARLFCLHFHPSSWLPPRNLPPPKLKLPPPNPQPFLRSSPTQQSAKQEVYLRQAHIIHCSSRHGTIYPH
jgi:hypothetical protein